MDREHYEAFNLTLVLHPSETLERMMTRLLAYIINAQEYLAFTQGLSTPDEPDIIVKAMDDEILTWIDVGEPAADRIKKASRQARAVKVYSFNSKSNIWWQQEQKKIKALPVSVYQFQWPQITALAQMVERTMDVSFTITGHSVYIAMNQGELEVTWNALQEVEGVY